MRCEAEPAVNLDRALSAIHRAARNGARDHLFAGIVPLAVLLPAARSRAVRPGRADSRPLDGASVRGGPRDGDRRRRLAVRAPHCLECTTTRRWSSTPTAACAACIARCTSRTIRCTSRSITSRPATPASAPSTTRFGRIGVLVCWDQWFPEAARLTALQGAEVLFYPTAIGWHPARESSSTAPPSARPGN